MKINDKILRLVKHGLKATNLTKLNESQINILYTRLTEQVTKIPGKTQFKIGTEGGNIPPNTKGYDIKQNPDKTVTAIPMGETEEINEKSVSKKQHGLMGAAYSVEKGDKEIKDIPKSYRGKVKKVVDSMSKKQIKDFAETKTKNLPKEVKEEEKYDLGDAFEKHAANYLTKVAQKSVPRIGEIGESQLEKEITRIVEKHLSPKMTKKDFMNIIENNLIVARESEMNEESEDEMGLPSWLRWENITKK
jgi:hypothetical protein